MSRFIPYIEKKRDYLAKLLKHFGLHDVVESVEAYPSGGGDSIVVHIDDNFNSGLLIRKDNPENNAENNINTDYYKLDTWQEHKGWVEINASTDFANICEQLALILLEERLEDYAVDNAHTL